MPRLKNKKRFFLHLSYNGAAYSGWQIQKNAISVQEIINKALSTLLKEEVETVGCGRTDTGVHAKSFYLHVDTSTDLNKVGLHSINSLLPFDIYIDHIIPVNSEAHARFDALERKYEYRIITTKNPFKKDYAALVTGKLDLVLMNKAAQMLVGEKSFEGFCKAKAAPTTGICDVSYAYFKEEGDEIVFYIAANRFLRNMVRAIVGTLIDIGRGKMEFAQMQIILSSKNRSDAGPSAPAHGLYLTEIRYPFI